MKYPISTGQAAALLGRTEPQLAELVRRGRIQPPPPIFAGRRLWHAEHVRKAAASLQITLGADEFTALDPVAPAPGAAQLEHSAGADPR